MTPEQPSRPGDEPVARPIPIDTDALFAAMSDAVLVLDRAGRWLGSAPTAISWDETARRRGEWLIGKRMHDVLDKAEAERLVAVIEVALDTGETQNVEYRVDIWGDERWFAAAVSPMDDDRVVWVARDVTDRVAAQKVLEQQVEQRTRELTALLEVSRALSSALDLRTLVTTILGQLGSVINYSGASVSRIEEEWIEVVDSVGPDGREDDLAGARLWLDVESGWWDVVRRGEPVVIDDVQGDSDYAREFRALLKDYVDRPGFTYMRSWMGVPLFLQERVVGMLTISKDEPGYFTQRQVDLALAVARQAAVVAENASLFEQTERRTRELTALLEVSRAVASTLDAREVLGAILGQLSAVTEHTGSAILLVQDDAFEIVEAESVTGTRAEIGARIPFDVAPVLSAAMRKGDTVIIDDVRADEPLAADYRAAISAIGLLDQPPFNVIRSWMAVPLGLKDRVLGVLTISWTEPAYFTEDHARLARAFADQAAVALENARLFEQAGDLAALEERQRLARDLHDSVSQALYGIALGARTARTQLDRDPAKAVEPVEYVLSLAEAGLAEMRSLIFELRPESLESEGLVAAIRKQAAVQEARHGIAVTCDLGDEPDVSPEAREAVYRIVQEALTNTLKHAKAANVRVTLRPEKGRLLAEVADDGIGFDPDRDYAGHLGLHSMRERAARLGGELRIESNPGSGTRVSAEVPLR